MRTGRSSGRLGDGGVTPVHTPCPGACWDTHPVHRMKDECESGTFEEYSNEDSEEPTRKKPDHNTEWIGSWKTVPSKSK